MNRSASVIIATLLALAPATQSWSEEQQGKEDSSGSHWGLGAGVGLRQQPYDGIDSETRVLPIIIYESRWISVAGAGIDFKLTSAGPVSFALRVDYSRDGYEASDSPVLRGMVEREDSLWYGAAASWHNDIVDVSAELLTDASDNSGGERASLGLKRDFDFGKFQFTPRVAATWLSEDYVDYYYGVSTAEALPSRAAYIGDAAVNFEAGLRTNYRLRPKQSLFLDIRAELLDDVIEDSPIVDGSTQSSLFLGYVYMFK